MTIDFKNLDYDLLATQKSRLVKQLWDTKEGDPEFELWGIVHILDDIMDAAEEQGEYTPPQEKPEEYASCTSHKATSLKKKSSGIIRRIDDLGRFAIPKDIRRTMQISEGDPIELCSQEDGLFIRKYIPEDDCKMSFFIGSECASGITASSKSEFFKYLEDEIEAAAKRAQKHFSIMIEDESVVDN